MDTLKKFAFIIILIISAGCTGNDNKTMDKAEALMQDNPKEALSLLDSIKRQPIVGNELNARFALLYSMALDKNYIDVTDDSLICIAEDWYSRKGDVREKFLSYYYKGVVNSNAKKYPEAITAFSQAQKYENQIDDNYLLGLLYNQMGYIYKEHYDHSKSLDAFSKAYHLYDNAGKTRHKNYMLLNIAGCYWNISDYTDSEHTYIKAISEGHKTNYWTLIDKSATELIGLYIEQNKYDDAEKLDKKYKLSQTSENAIFLGNIAKLFYKKGNNTNGKIMLQKAWRISKNIEDSMALYINEYHINKHLNKYDSAMQALEKIQMLESRAVSTKLQPVLEIQKKLLENDYLYSKYKLESGKKIATLISLLIFILISIALYILHVFISRKNKKISSYMELLAELQDNLQNLQEGLQEKDNQLNSAFTNTTDIINNRLSLINNLSTTIYEKRDTPKAKEIFIREVENIIEDFRTNENDLKWMEQVINSTKDNLLQNIYAKYPTLTKEEQRLLCYIYAGFSSKSISVFLNIPIETVYNRKSRILAKTGLSKAQNKITNTCKIPS